MKLSMLFLLMFAWSATNSAKAETMRVTDFAGNWGLVSGKIDSNGTSLSCKKGNADPSEDDEISLEVKKKKNGELQFAFAAVCDALNLEEQIFQFRFVGEDIYFQNEPVGKWNPQLKTIKFSFTKSLQGTDIQISGFLRYLPLKSGARMWLQMDLAIPGEKVQVKANLKKEIL